MPKMTRERDHVWVTRYFEERCVRCGTAKDWPLALKPCNSAGFDSKEERNKRARELRACVSSNGGQTG